MTAVFVTAVFKKIGLDAYKDDEPIYVVVNFHSGLERAQHSSVLHQTLKQPETLVRVREVNFFPGNRENG